MPEIDSKRYNVIHRRGKRQSLFWVQAGLVQAKVLQEIDRDQPVYCLYRLRPDAGQAPLTFQEIAAYHIETMRSVCPQGPYALAGYCVCAGLVFEMACQLSAQGEAVSALILIDPLDLAVSAAQVIQEPRLFRLRYNFSRIFFHLQKTRHFSTREKIAYWMKGFDSIAARFKRRPAQESSEDSVTGPRALPQHELLDVHDSDMYGFHRWVPQPYTGSATILRPAASPARGYEYPNRRWAQFIRNGVDVQSVPGDSDSMWVLPDAAGMARIIDSCVARSSRPLQTA